MCPTHCDTETAHCVCGLGSNFPDRPVNNRCGFDETQQLWHRFPSRELLYGNGSAKTPGWCNVDPAMAAQGHQVVLQQCGCSSRDGLLGEFCEVPVQEFCFNQCSGHGVCNNGFCKCEGGWYGLDCSIAPDLELDHGTSPLATPPNITNNDGEQQVHLMNVLNPEPVGMIASPCSWSPNCEGRMQRRACVLREYGWSNETWYINGLYGLEVLVTEGLLASEHRTLNAEEADYFYVPVMGGCAQGRADDSPRFDMQHRYNNSRPWLAAEIYREAYEHIQSNYSYWNRSQGRDHIWVFSWDEGACYAPQAIWSSIMLSHWGNTGSAHPGVTSAYWWDRWDVMPPSLRGDHPCYDPSKDVVLPAWKAPIFIKASQRQWERPLSERPTLFYFAGDLGFRYQPGRPDPRYSMGIRPRVAELFGSVPDKNGSLGSLAEAGVVVATGHTQDYDKQLSSSRFCGVFPGDGFSARMEDAVMHGCIPVIVQDGIHLPFENFLDYASFSVRIAEADIPKLVTILKAYSEQQVQRLWEGVQCVWQRWSWHSVLRLETERQRVLARPTSPFVDELDALTSDDAFATLLQVLHYKLYHDQWRVNGKSGGKPVNVRQGASSTPLA
eukprot:SM000192S04908  [mRNA]  locus=s192:268840:274943:+ [translate_table: standard]